MNPRLVAALLAIALIASGALNLFYHDRMKEMAKRPHFSPRDQPFIDRAERLWAAQSRETVAAVKASRYAQTFYFENELCVSLNLELGSLGGAPVYCFKDNGDLTRSYETVD